MKKLTKAQERKLMPKMIKELERQIASEFAAIRTMANVRRMSKRSAMRFMRWTALQHQLAAMRKELGK